jgi:hypothetical protein
MTSHWSNHSFIVMAWLAIGVPSFFPSWSVCSRIQRVPALRLDRPFLRRRCPTTVTSAV